MDTNAVELDLDIVGVLEGTDKSSSVAFAWDYLRQYQDLFSRWRDEPINLIEIGVAKGPSLNVWRKYFSRAQIIGVDIDPNCARLAGDRVVIEIGSQEDPAFLHSVCENYPPTIIIDDGSHLAHHIVYTFRRLFPILAPGGIYVVEDLEFHFGRWGDRWVGNKTVSAPDHFLELARGRMGNQPLPNDFGGDDRYISEQTDRISFIGSAVVIQKKARRDLAAALICAEDHLRSVTPTAGHYLRLAEYILRHNGPLEYAESSLHRAIALGGPNAEVLRFHVDVLIRMMRLGEAVEVAREATVQRPGDPMSWDRLAYAERQRGDIGAAIEAYEQVIALRPREAHYYDQITGLLHQKGEIGRALVAAQKASESNPGHEPWRMRVAELARLANAGS